MSESVLQKLPMLNNQPYDSCFPIADSDNRFVVGAALKNDHHAEHTLLKLY
jgi:hypothetical protein